MLRSMLFVPGDQPRKVEKALAALPADAVILDLEDAVAVSAKPATRAAVAGALALPRARRVYVRVNAVETPWFFGDLDAVVAAGLDGVMLPKTQSAEAVYLADRYLTHLESERGLPSGSIELLPLIESAAGAAALPAICAQGARLQRLRCIGFGATDYTVDLGATWTEDEHEILFVRTEMVLRSRAAGLEPPVDTVYPQFRDQDGFELRCRRSKALGFQGRMCIHPDQLEPCNRLYQPEPEEIAWAEEVLESFAAAEAQGIGALQVRGQLVDYAFVARARQILRQAGRAGEESLP